MARTSKNDQALTDLLGEVVVIDTQGPMLIIGRLVRIASDCYVLEDADVHDRDEGHSGKELYVINACKYGFRTNRQRVYVPRRNVVAISAIADVVTD